jgi:hypothetical protein
LRKTILLKNEIRLGKKKTHLYPMGVVQNPGGIKMRRKCETVLCFEFNLPKGPKPVLEYCEDYLATSQVLDAKMKDSPLQKPFFRGEMG